VDAAAANPNWLRAGAPTWKGSKKQSAVRPKRSELP